MPKFQDLTGMKYGKLTALKRAENRSNTTMWVCQCDCGNITTVAAHHLKNGHTKSCGCLFVPKSHVMTNTRLHRIWAAMKTICTNPNFFAYKNYGGRGIHICDEWMNSFETFYEWSMRNGYADDLTIDRIDNNRGYEPSNCRWATRSEQSSNRRSVHEITYNGETHNIKEWAEITGINYHTLFSRITNPKWSVERALCE